jgi:hypothetical protein
VTILSVVAENEQVHRSRWEQFLKWFAPIKYKSEFYENVETVGGVSGVLWRMLGY